MASISNSRLILILVVALVGVIAILLLGALLGLGLMFIGLALVLPMSAKWRFAFLVSGIILLVLAFFSILFHI